MALPKDPDRLEPHCEFPPSGRPYDPDDIWLDYGAPPPGYDPPVAEPVARPTPRQPLTVWQIGIRILLVLTAIIAGLCLWQL